jgi:UPF0755 protein
VAVVAAIFAWMLLASGTNFSEKSKNLYIYTGKNNEASVLATLKEEKIVGSTRLFGWTANRLSLWERLKPGKYEIKKGQSILSIVRMLRNNQQTPAKLVINKIRTNQDLAKVIGKNFEVDSLAVITYLSKTDSLQKLGVDENTLMTIVIPNTYALNWTSSVSKILNRLKTEKESFWKKNNRIQKAQELGLTPNQVYTIASIVEEETNQQPEKGNVASVYINRLQKGMPLGADPTIKFALKDFSLKRIYEKHLQVASPYNTYRNTGLPPGPICTPSPKTIDAVLTAPKTDYIFFVAKSDFSGYHTFSTTYAEHLQHAKEYQQKLNELMLRKQQKAAADL